ncbi:MAG: Verru_Chthon cassette protein D [Chthoniobacteraceae bacterium]
MRLPTLFRPVRAFAKTGFTLIEILVVMAIMSLMMALVVPAFQGVAKGTGLTRGGQMVADQFALGRQMAVCRNTEVEVRFVWNRNAYGAVQLWAPSSKNSATLVPITRMETLPAAVAIANTAVLSPLISGTAGTPTIAETQGVFPSLGSVKYCGFRFRAGGMTDLAYDSTSNYVTITSLRECGNTSLPVNYCIVQVDPLSGRTRTYRPQ